MTQVCIDNHVLIWGLREHAEVGQEAMIPRTKHFFGECKKNGTSIVVPSVVLGELLTAIDPKVHAMVVNLIRQSFQVAPYDAAAAVAFAQLWQQRKQAGVIEQIRAEGATRQELKADCMIVATAIVHQTKVIYSHDPKLKKFAGDAIVVMELPKIQVQENLFAAK